MPNRRFGGLDKQAQTFGLALTSYVLNTVLAVVFYSDLYSFFDFSTPFS
jgi:hypothetical protein